MSSVYCFLSLFFSINPFFATFLPVNKHFNCLICVIISLKNYLFLLFCIILYNYPFFVYRFTAVHFFAMYRKTSFLLLVISFSRSLFTLHYCPLSIQAPSPPYRSVPGLLFVNRPSLHNSRSHCRPCFPHRM